jgi:predicted RNA binding protein YcfA (HicA-like mRNA interferase family)
MKVRDLIILLKRNGWILERMKGSHRQFRNPEKPQLGTITIAGHLSDEHAKGTTNAVLRQAGLKESDRK